MASPMTPTTTEGAERPKVIGIVDHPKPRTIDLMLALKDSIERPCACGHPWNRHETRGATAGGCYDCGCVKFVEPSPERRVGERRGEDRKLPARAGWSGHACAHRQGTDRRGRRKHGQLFDAPSLQYHRRVTDRPRADRRSKP